MTTQKQATTMQVTAQKRAKVVSLSDKQKEKDRLESLVTRVAETQDRQAFSELFEHFAPLIKAFALSNPTGKDLNDFADELIQDVMIKIWNKASLYNAKHASVNTWVFTIVRNTRIDMLRKFQRSDFLLDSEEVFDFEDDSNQPLLEQVQQKHYERDMRQHLSELPIEQSQVLSKVYMEGKTHAEISEELDIPLGTVKSRVRMGLTKLKAIVVH